MTGSNNDISRLAARGSMDMDYFRIAMITYDGFIASLRSDQQDLALAAMRGKRTPWGSVAQGVTLKAALEIKHSRLGPHPLSGEGRAQDRRRQRGRPRPTPR